MTKFAAITAANPPKCRPRQAVHIWTLSTYREDTHWMCRCGAVDWWADEPMKDEKKGQET